MKKCLLVAAFFFGYSLWAAEFDVEAQIKAKIYVLAGHWNSRDMESFSQFYTDIAVFITMYNEKYIGKEAIAKRHLRVHEDTKAKLIINSILTEYFDSNHVFTQSLWTIESSTAAIHGIWRQCFVRRDGEWLIDYAHNQLLNK